MALFTGMRLNEICRLYLKNIKDVDGVLTIEVNAEEPDKSFNTESNKRQIPIHPQLIKLGLSACFQRIRDAEKRRAPKY